MWLLYLLIQIFQDFSRFIKLIISIFLPKLKIEILYQHIILEKYFVVMM